MGNLEDFSVQVGGRKGQRRSGDSGRVRTLDLGDEGAREEGRAGMGMGKMEGEGLEMGPWKEEEEEVVRGGRKGSPSFRSSRLV